MTPPEIDALLGAAGKATARPWFLSYSTIWGPASPTGDDERAIASVEIVAGDTPTQQGIYDGQYIELACNNAAPLAEEVKALRARVALLERVREAAEILVGPNNIGKTVDTNIYWDGAISAIMNGKALSAVMVTLAALREEPK